MKEKLNKIAEEAAAAIAAEGADLEALRIKYLGKKGELAAVLRGTGQLSAGTLLQLHKIQSIPSPVQRVHQTMHTILPALLHQMHQLSNL